jgi:hypothetical protein
MNFRWEGYYGDNWGLCNTCHSIIEEKVRKVLYPTQEEINEKKHQKINNKISILNQKINTITSNMKELQVKMDKILEQLS